MNAIDKIINVLYKFRESWCGLVIDKKIIKAKYTVELHIKQLSVKKQVSEKCFLEISKLVARGHDCVIFRRNENHLVIYEV